jgi:hypothetical protein
MKSFICGLVLGMLGPIVLGRLRNRAKVKTAAGRSETLAASGPETQTGESADVSSDDLTQLTRQQLYRRAQVAGIAGRSEMSKEQLIAALRAAKG